MNWRRWANALSWLVPIALVVHLTISIVTNPQERAEFWNARWHILIISICIPVALGFVVCLAIDAVRSTIRREEVQPRGFEVIRPKDQSPSARN